MSTRKEGRLTGPERRFVFIVLAPALLHFAVFTILPVLAGFSLSFHQWTLLGVPAWIGLQNYVHLFQDPVFIKALKNTFLFTLMYVPPMLVFSLGLAILVNRPGKASSFFKNLYFLPVVTSFVVFALVFRTIFQADPGSIANQLVGVLGIHSQGWLQDEQQALPLLALLGVLKGVAWNMVYFLAGLQAIPDSFYEAAHVDGAGRWRIFRSITLPLLRPTLYFVTVLTTIGAFQVFDSAYILTQGGPAYATTTIVYFIYQAGFENFQMGYASASAFVLLAMVIVVAWVQKRSLGRPADWY